MHAKRSVVWPVIILAVGLLPAVSPAQKQLTVETIFGSRELAGTLPSAVQWTPDGRAFTHLRRGEDGTLNLWRYSAASKQKSLLLDSKKVSVLAEERHEKRFVLGNYFWSPDGKSLLLPSNNDLYLYDLASGSTRRLTTDEAEERDPQFSPDSRQIAYLKNHNLMVQDLASGSVRQLTTAGEEHILVGRFDWVYEEEFSIRTGFFWSPDSRHLAYYQLDEREVNVFPLVDFIPVHNVDEPMRYPKAGDRNSLVKIGVVAADGSNGGTRWIDLGAETDIYIPRIKWLPGGRELAVLRLNRRQNHLEFLIADIATGNTRLLFEEKEDNGWIDIHDDWQFLAGGRQLLWLSWRDGWPHFYLYDMNGRVVRQLTRGAWGVTKLEGVDEKNKMVYFSATEKSHLESHLYRIKWDGTGLQRLTTREGWHVINLSPTAGYYLDHFSNVNTPTQVLLHKSDGSLVEVIEANEIPARRDYRFSPVEFGTLTTASNVTLHYWMIKPPDFDPSRKYPVLMYVYGGPGAQTVVNRWGGSRGYWHQMMAQLGYLVVSVDNRGTGGRGKHFMMQTYKNLGELETTDQIEAARYLAQQPYVDASRIGIWGWSYGGYMSAFCLLKGNEVFKAAVSVAPVTDWRNYDTIYTERYMLTPAQNPEGYERSAPLKYAGNLTGKLLLVHGANDDNVHLANTLQLAMALQDARKPFELMIYPRKDHGISGRDTQVHLYNLMTEFLRRNL
ncbi:MAG: DPP IV N-terminal domain-containing protein [candidate division KSB1 bacterium]|nr:DPP IV N-terminal domain-containing protein [candidate division KSB1 bacterium]MDZ7274875.1 DPP IV N-terminal domain-containing protein [candidate division KSB1 bacterium]MDZ7286673.1 DPP IV N-terminal domain-containing protein [candidate division KSB1 bacterium]MDZ7299164.1 DPP IV N-terminal domain-containing protein [candidate division KSB1 bacterium]MDZ7350028.1 DPP IV N-terminal domain-containing protein [candidate division KSB1 bacterium]